MEPVAFLRESLELRSHFAFFRDRSPCAGIRWEVTNGADVSEGQTLGNFLFTEHAPAPIICPVDGIVLRRFEPDGAALHQRPSQLVALLAPPRVRGGDDRQWHDIAPMHADAWRALLAAPPSAQVADNTIVATWSFSAAPSDFIVSITEVSDAGERPVTTLNPISLARRSSAISEDWVATIELSSSAEDRVFCLRTNTGHTLDVGTPEPTHKRAPVLPKDHFDRLLELQAFLDQQPDGGRELLANLMPSADPDQLRADIDAEIEGITPETRPIWPISVIYKPSVNGAALEQFCTQANIPQLSVDQVRDTVFQTKEDWKNYATAKGAAWFHVGGGQVDRPLSEEHALTPADMSHSIRAGEMTNNSISMALFADNGNGLYAARGVADQIAKSNLPYAFHLGDVYYGGTEDEMSRYFEAPLEPMFDRTELFMITGNHEMYASGTWFKRMITRKAADHAHQRQRAESFRLCGDGFQIIGLDTMFVGWKGGRVRRHDYADQARLALVRGWLQERPNDLNILLTTNHAWDIGSDKKTKLYESLRGTIAGNVDLWLWGNVHYAALFDAWPFSDTGSPTRRMVTSCIGHGGYPFYTQESVGRLPAPLQCRWLETKPRFYPTRIREDVGLNGWCRMTLTREPTNEWTVLLTYIDWLGRSRCRAKLGRKDGGSIYFKSVEESEIASTGATPTWHSRPLGSFR